MHIPQWTFLWRTLEKHEGACTYYVRNGTYVIGKVTDYLQDKSLEPENFAIRGLRIPRILCANTGNTALHTAGAVEFHSATSSVWYVLQDKIITKRWFTLEWTGT